MKVCVGGGCDRCVGMGVCGRTYIQPPLLTMAIC